jgi:hypothetical protein
MSFDFGGCPHSLDFATTLQREGAKLSRSFQRFSSPYPLRDSIKLCAFAINTLKKPGKIHYFGRAFLFALAVK